MRENTKPIGYNNTIFCAICVSNVQVTRILYYNALCTVRVFIKTRVVYCVCAYLYTCVIVVLYRRAGRAQCNRAVQSGFVRQHVPRRPSVVSTILFDP